MRRWSCPGIQSTDRAGVLRLAPVLGPCPSIPWGRLPAQMKPAVMEFGIGLDVEPIRENVMAHALPDFLATWLTSVAWLEPYRFHLCGPRTVMVVTSGRCPIRLLPDMNHFMHQRREDFDI